MTASNRGLKQITDQDDAYPGVFTNLDDFILNQEKLILRWKQVQTPNVLLNFWRKEKMYCFVSMTFYELLNRLLKAILVVMNTNTYSLS